MEKKEDKIVLKVGIVGLGKMGLQIAKKLAKAGFEVFGFDAYTVCKGEELITVVPTLVALAQNCDIVWLMVPAGDPVDSCIQELLPHLKAQSIVVDGGNSNYKDSKRRAALLRSKGFYLIDCGTSGGTHGLEHGFCLMIGGDEEAYEKAKPVFNTLAAENGFGRVGCSGSGHFVKTVHNGIEYGLLQAYAEGFHVLRDGPYKDLDLASVSKIWENGSVIRSWILSLCSNILTKDQKLDNISGYIDENLTGRWTLEAGEEFQVPTPVTRAALDMRTWSRKSGGNFGTKVVAMLRNGFGGHAVKTIAEAPVIPVIEANSLCAPFNEDDYTRINEEYVLQISFLEKQKHFFFFTGVAVGLGACSLIYTYIRNSKK